MKGQDIKQRPARMLFKQSRGEMVMSVTCEVILDGMVTTDQVINRIV